MSLDVYLELPGQPRDSDTEPRIFIRKDGQTKQVSRAEWDTLYPDREPVTVMPSEEGDMAVYTANITHNLNTMAQEAGIYQALWRPEEIGITYAVQLVPLLRDGLLLLLDAPQRFQAYTPSNGWGTYYGLVDFVRDYLAACEQYPGATVRVWR